MFKNYLKIAWRTLLKNKVYLAINTIGLSIAIVVSFLILLWTLDEYRMDKFHENDDQLVLVKRTIPLEAEVLDVYSGISYPLLKAAQEKFPEVEKYIALGASFEDNLRIEDTDFRASGAYTNAAFFESFSYPVLLGNIAALDDKREAIAISENLATRFWGENWRQVALGSPVHIYDNGDFTVEAVYADFPTTSSIQNDFYYGFERYLIENDWMLEWGNNGMQGALLLRAGTNIAELRTKIEELFQENISGEFKEGILLHPFSDNYLYNQFDEKAQVSGGRIDYVRIFVLAAVFLLIISCINFINLSTAHATKRTGEIGIRKVVGAKKKSLMGQFLTETGIITSISFIVAFLLTTLLLPLMNTLTGKNIALDLSDPQLWLVILGVFLLITLLSGFYPSLIISSFQPVDALKGGSGKEQNSTVSLRKGLVVVQFSLSILLIISALVIQRQINYINQKDLGIEKDHIVSIHQDEVITDNYEALKNHLMNSGSIVDVTLVGPSPLETPASSSGVNWPGKRQEQENIEFALLWTAHNFPTAFGIPVEYGNYYREGSQDTLNLVVNETAASLMQLGADPIGKTVELWGSQRHVIGVLKDFHNRSLFEPIQPTIFILEPENAGELFVKLDGTNIPDALASVKSAFEEIIPSAPLHYDFLDEEYAMNYRAEVLTGKLARYFAIISTLISCLGLFGLAIFMVKQRTKEIGIRKVLGASVNNITVLISKDFLKLIGLAILFAAPLAYYFMLQWLEDFEYRTAIPLWVFALSAMLIIGVTLLTISFHAIKSASASPVDSLRTE